jgi:uncharacterized CHY-type Zn-finger protein
MKPQDFKIQTIIDALLGTSDLICNAVENCYPGMEEDDLTIWDLQQIDHQIFLCDNCGEWVMSREKYAIDLCINCQTE